MNMEIDADAQRALLHHAVDVTVDHGQRVRDLPVAVPSSSDAVRQRLAAFDLDAGAADPESLVSAIAELLEDHTVLTTHPRYFGLFNPSPLVAGVAADIVTAGFNPQLAVWSHAPAAVEIEAHVISEVGRWFGLDRAAGSFTTGGAEANATAVVAALHRADPRVAGQGVRGLTGLPVMYASSESHLAWLKIAQQSGIGRDAVRLIPVDPSLRMDVSRLRAMIADDQRAGAVPFLLVATAGTTGAGVIDPLPDLGDVAGETGLWLHVDAAWGGAAAASEVLRPQLTGIESADSLTVDAHKWLSVPMGAGMFLTPHGDVLDEAFSVSTSYMPPASGQARDPYTSSMQWSRRAAGLKLFMTLAAYGRRGYAQLVERHVLLGDRLREALRADGWQVLNETPLPVVCVQDPGYVADRRFHEAVTDSVVREGAAWVSTVQLDGRTAVRACVISHRTSEEDVDILVNALRRARETQRRG